MGLFRGAVFHHGRGARKLPITMISGNGALLLLSAAFSDLNGPFPRMPKWAVFRLENPLENSPFRNRGIIIRAPKSDEF